ncbi:MAG: hypothetical protein LJF04_14090 [Gemmatimonadetes bacterium]|nr:hypothetical protein [Gemmatimonadota bacterium]
MLFLAALLATACSGNKSTEPDSAIAPFVGDWIAQSLVLTSQANPDISGDIIQLGATFTLNVQPSGQYTAILLYAGQSLTEIGTLEVAGSTVTLHQTFPAASTSAGVFSFEGGHLIIDANTEFDFNQDGTDEPALAHFDLVKK